MPRLWSSTIEAHRREVRDAAVDVTATLVNERGLRSVTMSEIAARTGVGRATLYKYFPDVESILRAWHEREIGSHLALLVDARDGAVGPAAKLRVVLQSFAAIAHQAHGPHDAELAALLHRDAGPLARAQAEVNALVTDVLREAVAEGGVRSDVAPEELASYCLHALAAAGTLSSEKAIARLVDVTLAGLRPV